jgi:hypothetical protein
MNQDLQLRAHGRPKSTLTLEERKKKHATYMKEYYARNKQHMNDNARRSYLRKNPPQAVQVAVGMQ